METSVLHTLEFHKVRTMLTERAGSVMGKELAESLVPISDAGKIQEALEETSEARDVMVSYPSIPLGGIRDIRNIIKRAGLGAVLEPTDLLRVGSTLYAVRRLKGFMTDLDIPIPKLKRLVSQLTMLRNIENLIENTVSEQGAVRDDASAELSRIRREIKIAQNRVKEKLNSILHSPEYQKYFQDALVTMRGDRYVIPIKQEYRHNFPGLVHDQSASGATVFIEPMPVVNLNNDIKQLASAEKTEIERILANVTGQIAKNETELTINGTIMAQLDFAFAKAQLGIDMKAEMPLINSSGYVNLKQARHPLIPDNSVVPIDIHIGRDFNTLLITGPNTGGKTVSLKTLGLFALMSQAGLFIPAGFGSEITIFRQIFADIGDEQSIEQSLSTFSAHMTNLVKIISCVTENDLVLIDEIGAGTDPDEGAALAMSILEYLHSLGAKTVATTHYSELKAFAYAREGVENSCVEFDVHTLRPTYRLLIGVPGSSNAFAISARLGLNKAIVDRARQLIDKDYAEFETVLSSVEEQKRLYDQKNREVQLLEREIKEMRDKIAQERTEFTNKKSALLLKAQNDAAAVLRQARREAEEVIGELKAQFNVHNFKDVQKKIDDARSKIKNNMGKINLLENDNKEALPEILPNEVKPGMYVYVTTLQQKGTVLSVNHHELTIQMGVMKVNVRLEDCRKLEEKQKVNAANTSRSILTKIQDVSRQIDLRGVTVEEGEILLDKYLDDAILAGIPEVIIIHGKGTGALRKGIRDYLKSHPYVKETRIGELNEGGNGATIVKLS